MTKRLVVIDGKSVFYRGYYAMPYLSTRDGTPTGGVYGFAALALEIFKKLKPDYVAVAWDKKGTNIRKRKAIYPEYKAGRKPPPPDFYEQIPLLYEFLEAFSWPLYEYDDFEADDIMATLADKASREGIETCLITSDLDALQSIGPLTHVYALKKGFSNIEMFDPHSFEQKYGLRVDQFLDLKSLKGDSSDNIPGVAGVGEKTAVDLLQRYETLDGVYEHLYELKDTLRRKLEAGKESAYMSRQIAELWLDAPVELDYEALDVTRLDVTAVKYILTRLEFKSLLRALPEHMKVLADDQTSRDVAIGPVDVAPFDEVARVTLTMGGPVYVVAKDEGSWLVAVDGGKAYEVPPSELVTLLADGQIVAHAAKPYLKSLLKAGADKLPVVHHDTEQAAFLLDSLERDRGLGALTGADVGDCRVAMGALQGLYAEQTKALSDLPKLESLAHDIDFALIPILARMEYHGILLDSNLLSEMNADLDIRLDNLRSQLYEHTGYEFNINSPSQLAEVLFTKLQLPTAGIKKGKTGYSTGQKELDKLRGQHPIIEDIEQYRELTKLQNTYVESLPKLVDASGKLHTTFNQDVAATGRLSSTDPNLQNIPIRTELGRKIRDAFVPGEGNVFVSADYSQFELRLAAVLAGDKQMIDDFNSGIDIHTKTASDVYGVPLQEVTKAQRRDAKVINFGVLYGMSPHGLSAATGMNFHDAKVFIDNYFQLRAPIRNYIDATLARAKEVGYVETLFGRRRPTPDIGSSNFIVRQAAERAAANMPIQGTEADLMKLAMIAVEGKLRDNSISNLGWQVLQIHDSILIECPQSQSDAVAKMLKRTMEHVYPELGIDLKVDVSVGKNWGEL